MTPELVALKAALGDYDMLVVVVRSQIEDGRDRNAIIDDLQSLRIDGQDEGVDEPETMLMHISDRVYGFCSPHLAL